MPGKCCDADGERGASGSPRPVTPPCHVGSNCHLLVDEPQRVLDVRALESDGRSGALEQLHEQVVEEPDWGEDHVAQLKRQDRPTRSAQAWGGAGLFLKRARRFTPPGFCSRYPHSWKHLTILIRGTSQHACWHWLGGVTERRLMKPFTALLSPFPLKVQGQRKLHN